MAFFKVILLVSVTPWSVAEGSGAYASQLDGSIAPPEPTTKKTDSKDFKKSIVYPLIVFVDDHYLAR